MDGDYAAGRDAPPDELGPGLLTGSAAFLDGALANPRLAAEHLVAILRNPAVTPALIQRIARSPIWMRIDQLRAAMVVNARTPRRLAMTLLPTLRWGDLLRASGAPQIASTVRSSAAAILGVRLPELEPGERVTLARAAPAALIPLLLRESDPLVARAVLDNPRTRGEDALAMIDRPDAPPAVLKVVADCPRFAGLEELQLVIAAHPRTPVVTALKLVNALPAGALTRLVASESLPALVRVAATRRLGETGDGSRTIV